MRKESLSMDQQHSKQPLYLQEFPDYDDKLRMIDGFVDASYHNDAAPCIAKYYDLEKEDAPTTAVEVYQDYKNPELSELSGEPNHKRYNVFKNTYSSKDGGDISCVLSTNSWEKAKKRAIQLTKEIEKKSPSKSAAER